MNIYCVGISHHTAPLDVREPIAFSQEERRSGLAAFREQQSHRFPFLAELAILSTCNRIELYASAEAAAGNQPDADQVYAALIQFAGGCKGLSLDPWSDSFYRYEGTEAVEHLCRVAAGLDSMVVGEPQILGQISEAHQAAVESGAARHVLSSLFRAAIQAGKRARTETYISQNPASVSSIAVRLAEEILGDLEEKQVLVVGAGEMGQLTVKTLTGRGARRIWIANRSYDRSMDLAQRWGGQAVAFEALTETLARADLAITSTGASAPVLDYDTVFPAAESRSHPLILIDLAVPRDVHPDVRDISNVHLFDMDDLQQRLADSLTLRANEIPRVEAIVAEEVDHFAHWMEVIPVVGELHRKAEAIRQQELERALKHMPDLPPEAQEHIDHLSRSLVKKILHEPTVKLRTEARNGSLHRYMDTLKFLFGLDR